MDLQFTFIRYDFNDFIYVIISGGKKIIVALPVRLTGMNSFRELRHDINDINVL